MPQTFIALYRPGPVWSAGKPLKNQPPPEHGRYLLSLYAKGILKFAGPFMDDAGAAVVIEAADANEAQAIIDQDPAIAARIFVADVHPWELVPWQQYLERAKNMGQR